MERRVLLAIFLSFLVLSVYQALVVKPVPKRPPSAPANTATQPVSAAAPAPPVPAPESVRPPAERSGATPLVSEASERDISVETSDVIAVFTNRGGRLKSWRLKRYKDAKGEPQELIESGLAIPSPTGTLDQQPLPFTLKTSDEEVTARVN